MSGDPFAEEFGAGGPSDDGVGMGVWRAFQCLDEARAAHVRAVRDSGVSPLLAVLLASLSAPDGGDVR